MQKLLDDPSALDEMKGLLNKELSWRVYAADKGLLAVLQGLTTGEHRAKAVETLAIFLKHQPDLLSDSDLATYTRDLLEAEPPLACSYLKLLSRACVLSEHNRQALVKLGVVPQVVTLMQENRDRPLLIKRCCSFLRTLTLDDDVRVAFGQSHEHAKLIMSDTPALGTMLDLCALYNSPDTYKTMVEVFSTLSALSVRDEFCQEVLDRGGIALIVTAVSSYMDYSIIVGAAFGVLRSLSRNDDVKRALGEEETLLTLVTAASKYVRQLPVTLQFVGLLGNVTLRCPEHSQRLVDLHGAQLLSQVAHIHRADAALMRSVCMCVRNMAARDPGTVCSTLLLQGFEPLLNQMLSVCEDEAKAALVALNCDVKFKADLWTGVNGEIPRD